MPEMKNVLVFLLCTSVSAILAMGAVWLALEGKDMWGWFLAGSILCIPIYK